MESSPEHTEVTSCRGKSSVIYSAASASSPSDPSSSSSSSAVKALRGTAYKRMTGCERKRSDPATSSDGRYSGGFQERLAPPQSRSRAQKKGDIFRRLRLMMRFRAMYPDLGASSTVETKSYRLIKGSAEHGIENRATLTPRRRRPLMEGTTKS